GSDTLGKRPLRHQFDLQLARKKLTLELFVFTDVGRNHLLDLMRAEKHPGAKLVHAGVIADDREISGPAGVKFPDEVFRNPAKPEAADHDRRYVGDERDGFVRARDYFVHSDVDRSVRFLRHAPALWKILASRSPVVKSLRSSFNTSISRSSAGPISSAL